MGIQLSLIIPVVPFLYLLYILSPDMTSNLFLLNSSNQLPLYLYFSGCILAVLPYALLNQRVSSSKFQIFVYLIFGPLVYLFTSTSNILTFFMCYELFLLPSFALVLFGSPNRRGVLSSIYFLMWTQVGSFLVFLAVLGYIKASRSFLLATNLFTIDKLNILAILGFGIKIPMWPAHYWLTKTHVEAPTYFSIYLSGFLVKTALYGIWVFSFNLNSVYQTGLLVLAFVGIIDSSLKFWGQSDLKKLIAYGTVQEMNLILVGFFLCSKVVVMYTSLFIIAHTLLSTLFFLQVDMLYKRFSSRSVVGVRGILQTTPTLGWNLVLSCLLFMGLPFTLKFSAEIFIFTQVWYISTPTLVVLVAVGNWVGIVGFMRHWFGVLFGNSSLSTPDMSRKELAVNFTISVLLVLLPFMSYINF